MCATFTDNLDFSHLYSRDIHQPHSTHPSNWTYSTHPCRGSNLIHSTHPRRGTINSNWIHSTQPNRDSNWIYSIWSIWYIANVKVETVDDGWCGGSPKIRSQIHDKSGYSIRLMLHTHHSSLYLHEVFQNLRWKDVGLWQIFLTNYLYLHSFWKDKGIIPMNDQYMRLQCLEQIHTRWSHLLLKHPLYIKLSFALVTMANNSFPSSYPWTSLGWWIMKSLPLSLGNLTANFRAVLCVHKALTPISMDNTGNLYESGLKLVSDISFTNGSWNSVNSLPELFYITANLG